MKTDFCDQTRTLKNSCTIHDTTCQTRKIHFNSANRHIKITPFFHHAAVVTVSMRIILKLSLRFGRLMNLRILNQKRANEADDSKIGHKVYRNRCGKRDC